MTILSPISETSQEQSHTQILPISYDIGNNLNTSTGYSKNKMLITIKEYSDISYEMGNNLNTNNSKNKMLITIKG